jgi:hypothetical protein
VVPSALIEGASAKPVMAPMGVPGPKGWPGPERTASSISGTLPTGSAWVKNSSRPSADTAAAYVSEPARFTSARSRVLRGSGTNPVPTRSYTTSSALVGAEPSTKRPTLTYSLDPSGLTSTSKSTRPEPAVTPGTRWSRRSLPAPNLPEYTVDPVET